MTTQKFSHSGNKTTYGIPLESARGGGRGGLEGMERTEVVFFG